MDKEIKIAFIKNEEERWVIYSAEGIRLGAADDRDFAIQLAKQNEFEPVSVH